MTQLETLHIAQGIGSAQHINVRLGSSVADIAEAVHGALDDLTAWVRAPAGHANEWIEIPRSMWCVIKPKIDGVIMFGYRCGKSALRSILSIVAAVLVAVVAPYLGPAGIGLLTASQAAIAAAAVGVGASLALNALFPPEVPAFGGTDEAAKQFANVETDSNVLAREAYLPIVINRRVSPPEIASPFAFLENGIQTLQRIFAFDGHHSITDVQVDGTPVADFDSITTEIKDGAETSSVSTFINKITKSVRIAENLSTFMLDDEVLVDQVDPDNSSPRWLRFTTAADTKMEEISIRMQIQGFAKSDDPKKDIRVPLRFRFRPKGSTGDWFNVPEIHMIGRDISTGLKEFRFRWDGDFNDSETGGDITFQFFKKVPESSTTSWGLGGLQWETDEHFGSTVSNLANANIAGRRNGVLITLDEDIFPKVEYEWEVKRGVSMKAASFSGASYELNGTVTSLFEAKYISSEWVVPIDQDVYLSNLSLPQAATIVDREPCQRPGTALLAIKSIGQSITNTTAHVDKNVYDWDGSGWNTLTITKNPATHFRQILFDCLTYHDLDTDLANNQSFVDWRAECIAQGYELSAVLAGESHQENMDRIAVAGFARRVYSDGLGVDWFRDRSSDRPVQSFSPRDARIGLDWLAGQRPSGIRVKFENEDKNFKADEIQVNNPFYTNIGAYVVSNYSTISNPALAERRAYYDLLQAHYQGRRIWSIETAIEGMVCERGDLIAVVSDLVSDASSGARIREVQSANTFKIDQTIPVEGTESIFDVDNIFTEDNIFTTGAQSVCLFSTPTGTELRTITAASGDVIRVDSDLPSTDLLGSHVVIGPSPKFTSRCIVSEVQRKSEERATLICVDEAPEIYAAIQEKYS